MDDLLGGESENQDTTSDFEISREVKLPKKTIYETQIKTTSLKEHTIQCPPNKKQKITSFNSFSDNKLVIKNTSKKLTKSMTESIENNFGFDKDRFSSSSDENDLKDVNDFNNLTKIAFVKLISTTPPIKKDECSEIIVGSPKKLKKNVKVFRKVFLLIVVWQH